MTSTDPHAKHPGDHHYSPDELHNADVAHEHTDVDVRTILMYAAGLAAVVLVVHVIILGVFHVLEGQAANNDPQLSPLSVPAGQLPPEPRLLTNEYQQLEKERAKEADALKGMAEAKKNAIGQLPARAGAPVDERLGTTLPARGESSGGRTITGHPAPAAPATPPAPAAPAKPHGGGH
jgi:hypothetical protein